MKEALRRRVRYLLIVTAIIAISAGSSASLALESDVTEDGESRIIITSDMMETTNSAEVITFRGNVVAREDFLLCSDELELNYGDSREITFIVATGNVSVVRDGKVSNGDKAVYDKSKGEVVVSGNATATQCTDTVSGDKITFYLDREDVLVESGSGGRVSAVIVPGKKCAEERVPVEELQCRGAR